jgi:hypothetical protein
MVVNGMSSRRFMTKAQRDGRQKRSSIPVQPFGMLDFPVRVRHIDPFGHEWNQSNGEAFALAERQIIWSLTPKTIAQERLNERPSTLL